MAALRPALVAVLAWTVLFSLPAVAGGERLTATPDQLRALYVQRLVKYMAWPEGRGPAPGEPFIVAATDPARLKPWFPDPGEGGGDDGVRFKLVRWPADCHVLVLTGAPTREMAAVLMRVADLPVLTVTQDLHGPERGAIINFYMRGGHLRIEVNPAAARRAGLAVSSRLLQLARIYSGEER